jgi:hypothetical protein
MKLQGLAPESLVAESIKAEGGPALVHHGGSVVVNFLVVMIKDYGLRDK